MSELASIGQYIHADLMPHRHEWDAILCGGDFHAIAVGALASAITELPLMAVCSAGHDCTVQHTVCYGDVRPGMRYLYIDDFFGFGRTLATVFAYLDQTADTLPDRKRSSEHITATYEVTTREYKAR